MPLQFLLLDTNFAIQTKTFYIPTKPGMNMPSGSQSSDKKTNDSNTSSTGKLHSWDVGRKKYIYPMITIQENNYRYSFYCSNNDGVVRDNIYLRKASMINGQWEYGEEKLVLPHGAEEKSGEYIWDKKHVCDPAIVAGEFTLGSEKYQYVMFYTGVSNDGGVGYNNSLGIAVAKELEGPWHKRNGPLLSPFPGEETFWGVGQPSATSIDGKGKILLFYTRGSSKKTAIYRHPIDLSDVEKPIIQESDAMELPINGLTQLNDSSETWLNNGFLMFDGINDRFWIVRDGHPYPRNDFISEFIQIASAPGSLIWEGKGNWKVHGNMKTNAYRNHNSRFVTDTYGGIINRNQLEINLTIAIKPCLLFSWFDSHARLWSYRPATISISPNSSIDEHKFFKFKI